MRLAFSYTAEDYVEAAGPVMAERTVRRVGAERPLGRVIAWATTGAGFLLMIAAGVYLVAADGPGWWTAVLFVGLVSTPFLLGSYRGLFGQRQAARAAFDAETDRAGPATFEADEAGVRFVARVYRCDLAWSAVTGLYETAGLFLMADDGPTSWIVPKRAFADDAQQEQFRRLFRDEFARAAAE